MPTTKKELTKTETKAERFIRIAENRVNKLLKYIKLLGNCSNTSNYEYNKEQITNMFNSIYETLEITENQFSSKTEKADTFKF